MSGKAKQSTRCKHPNYNPHLDNHHENLKNYLLYRNELGFNGRWLGFGRVSGMILTNQHGKLCHQCSSWSSFLWKIMRSVCLRRVDQDSVVGIVACYELHGPGIESWWGWDFLYQPWGPPSLLYNGYWVFPGGKAARAWRWQPTPSSIEVKERIGL